MRNNPDRSPLKDGGGISDLPNEGAGVAPSTPGLETNKLPGGTEVQKIRNEQGEIVSVTQKLPDGTEIRENYGGETPIITTKHPDGHQTMDIRGRDADITGIMK